MAWTAVTDPSGGGSLQTLKYLGGALYMGGTGHIWKSTDHAATWTEIGAGQLPSVCDVTAIAIAPGGTLTLGTNKKTPYNPSVYWYDGATWTLATGYPTNVTLKISSLCAAYGKLFLGTAFQGDAYVSTNDGHTWSLYANNSTIRDPSDPAAGAIWTLGLIYDGRLAASGEFGTSGGSGGIFRDPRTGGQWVNVGPLNSDGYSANVKVWFCDGPRADDGAIFCGRKHSSDGHYVCKSTAEPTFSGSSTGLAVNQVVLNLVKDATGAYWESQQPTSGDGHTYRSVNSGANWSTYESGLPASTWAIDRGMAADDAYVYMIANTGGLYRAPAGG